MDDIKNYLKSRGFIFQPDFRNEYNKQIYDFFNGEHRVTVVDLVDKYQIMVYYNSNIMSTTTKNPMKYLKEVLGE